MTTTTSTTATTAAQVALWLLVALPAGTGGALLVLPALRRAAVPIALTVSSLVVALSAVAVAARPSVSMPFVAGADLGLAVDGLSAFVLPMVTVVTLLVLVFAAGDVRTDRARFHGLMLLFSAAASLTATATTLPTLLVGWEVMGAMSYALIGFWWWEDSRVSAGLTAFLTTRAADLGLYLAAGAALAGGSGLALADLVSAASPWRDVVVAGILVSALGKAAQLPFSFWLSRAMEGPSPVSALLHSAAMVAMGGYLLLRAEPLVASTGWAPAATAWVGVLTAIALGVVALAQHDLKQLLAASTGSQLGFVVLAAGVGAVAGGTAQLVAHAATKALLFLAAGSWLTALGTKHLDGLVGVARRWPLVGWCATVGALALAGVPPLSLWATKDAVLAGALEQSVWLYAAGLAAAGLSAAYAARILVVVWRSTDGREERARAHLDEEEEGTREVTTWQRVPLVLLAAGAAVLGLLALPPVASVLTEVVAEAVGAGGPESTAASPLELATSGVLALAVVLLLVLLARRGSRWLETPGSSWLGSWLGLESAAHRVVVRPTLALAARLDRLDRGLDRGVGAVLGGVLGLSRGATRVDGGLDRGVTGVAARTVRLGHLATSAEQGVDALVQGLAARVRGLGRLARRPQTGQLHHYYLEAVAVLAAALLLLLTVR
ncbi:MAG: proton-conducting transporter membrane subunit [Terracoccus sp.]